MIVVDTNLVAYLYLSTDHSETAEEVFRRDMEWCAPVLWRSEFRNVLVQYVKKNLLSLSDACKIMKKATGLLALREYEVSSANVLTLAAGSRCSAYDCEFVALAVRLQIPLVTFDKQIQQEFPDIALSPDWFLKQSS